MWTIILVLLFLSLSGLRGHHATHITKLYHFVDQKMNWADAQLYCREHFDDLATVHNLGELEQLQESRKELDHDIDTAWIGLHDDLTRWKWYKGEDYHYDNWSEGEPNAIDHTWICAAIKSNSGKWVDSPCTTQHNGVCVDDEGNYIVETKGMSWWEARNYCHSINAELASVKDETENSKIFAKLEHRTWIGLTRKPWAHWSNGSRATYFHWKTGQPDYRGLQRCVVMDFAGAGYDDTDCQDLHYVACQKWPKIRSTIRMQISSEADMTDPEVQRQFVEQLNSKLAKEGGTGIKIRWVLKEEQNQQKKK